MSDKTEGSRRPAPFPSHRGLATLGERLVPLAEFSRAARAHGRRLDEVARRAEIERQWAPIEDGTPIEGSYGCVAVFGGVYSNHLALEALFADAARRGAEVLYCLGDLGGFGPTPDRVWPLLRERDVRVIQGNYEQALALGLSDCNCGYTDPRDNHFAALSYDYTARSTSAGFKAWMGQLPSRRRIVVGTRELLLVHGSPRQVNEFLFRSTCSVAFLERLLDRHRAHGLLCTHTGLDWLRRLPSGRLAGNVGVIGRPPNDGRPQVRYAVVRARGGEIDIEIVPLAYDHERLAAEMRAEELPPEFIETILTGWWTTCLEILPAKERAASRY